MARTFRTLMQSIVSPVLSTSLYFVVFGAAIGSRMGSRRRGQLRRLHRARTDHAVDPQREHLECLVRHLSAEVVRHDLRAAVRAGLVRRGADRVRRGGEHQVGDARHPDPGDGAAVRRLRDPAPGVDGGLPAADRGELQPVRLHHRPLGGELRAAAGRAADDSSRRSPFSAARSTRSACCRRSGRRSRSSTPWFI